VASSNGVPKGDTGVSASPFFGRQSEVNLSGAFGTVRLGRWISESYFATADYVSMHNHDTGSSSDALYAYWFSFANIGHVFYGTNDFNPAGTSSPTTTITRLQATRDRLRANPSIKKVGASKLLISRDTTDNYATEANQSIGTWTGWVAGGSPYLVNDAIDTMGFDYVLNHNSIRGVDPYNWKANGTAYGFARDSRHPSNGGHAAMATEAQPIMAAQ
jgi:hypothetical protein